MHGFLSRVLVFDAICGLFSCGLEKMVECFVLLLVRMERIKRIGVAAAIRQKPGKIHVLWRTALQAEDRIEDYPGTPPPSVYQVTHGTAFQAAECSVKLCVMVLPSWQQSAM